MNCNTCGDDITSHYYWCDKFKKKPCTECGSNQHLDCHTGEISRNILIEDIREGSNMLVGRDNEGNIIVRLRHKMCEPFETKYSSYISQHFKRRHGAKPMWEGRTEDVYEKVIDRTFGCDNHKMVLLSNTRGNAYSSTDRRKSYYCYSCKSSVNYFEEDRRIY